MSERKLCILIADDDAEMQAILKDYFTHHGFKALVAGDGERALALAETHALDLALVDVRMPGPSGRALAARLKALHPSIMIIIITAHGTISDTVQALHEGVFSYLEKPVVPRHVLAVVEKALAAQRAQVPVQVGELVIDLQKRQAILGNEPLPLSNLEYDLLAYLVLHRGRVVSYEELLEQVWPGSSDCYTSKPVHLAVSRLRRRLGDDPDAPRYVVNVRGVGYRLG